MPSEAPVEERSLPGRPQPEVYSPPPRRAPYGLVGLVFMILNRVRHGLRGYRTPRPFSSSDYQLAVDYSLGVVEHWLRFLRHYRGPAFDFRDRRVLELGPGPDLGVALILLAAGARSYAALDAHPLVRPDQEEAHELLLEELARRDLPGLERARSALDDFLGGVADGPIRYQVDPDFDVGALAGRDVDLVVSQAAFEHFDDVETTLDQLFRIVRPGTTLVAEVDLQTHTRWLRDRDPLNIYRYSPGLYRSLMFKGSPNRLRSHDYVEILERVGWRNVELHELTLLPEDYVARVRPTLARAFRSPRYAMRALNVMICAEK